MDSSGAWRPVEGGQYWSDGIRHFGVAGGYYGDLTRATAGERVCRADVGGQPAFIVWRRTVGDTRIGASWVNQPRGLALMVGGVSGDTADLTFFWTVLRTVQIHE